MVNIHGIKKHIAEIKIKLKLKKYRWKEHALEKKLFILKRVLTSKKKKKAKLRSKK